MQKITTFLWFDNQMVEAVNFYTGLFPNSRITSMSPMNSSFVLDGVEFMALNGGPQFQFTDAVSLFVNCADQTEVDYFWDAFMGSGARPTACGWLKDKYGLSWQIIPNALMRYLSDPDRQKADRVMQAMLKMQKIVVADLDAAYAG